MNLLSARSSLTGIFLSSAVAALAQSSLVTELDTLVVSANRTPTDAAAVTSSVTVMDLPDLAAAQVDSLASALSEVPGLSVMQTGAPGGPTSVFIRGGGADHTLFMVDGVRMNTSDASYNNYLGAAGICGLDRAEVLRGPQGTLYGASAMGGVIVLESARGGGDNRGQVSLEAGSFNTYRGSVEWRGATSGLNYAASLSGVSSDNDRAYNTYDQFSYTARLETQLNDRLTVGWTLRGQDVDTGSPGSVGSTYVGEVDSRENLSTVYALWQPSDQLSSRLTYGWVQQEYVYTPVPPPVGNAWDTDYYSRDTRNVIDWQTNWDPASSVSVVGGITVETEDIATVSPTDNDRFANDSNAAYALVNYTPAEGTTLFGGVRYDDYDQFGDATTWKAGASQVFATGTKLRVNYGTGFAAPRPIYVQGGPWYNANPDILPEESEGWDFGIDQEFGNGVAVASLTYFTNDFENLLVYDFTVPGMLNTGIASSDGVEAALLINATERVSLRFAYTQLNADNDELDVPLLRRPEHRFSGQVIFRPTDELIVGAGFEGVDGGFDGSSSAPVAVPGWTVFRFFGSYDLGNGLRVKARIENAFDKAYEPISGYPALPLGVFGGIDWSF
ncbi:TonB-dependent receptor plug domain-containing protein [Actomonas aquatica]|uniref:TonB-dependent receptor n=1 Tax=Actomonas aquatica TaxID=2866162 RepID=A0ABZ1CE73_9BACT|nr:TonB-dependent receptor [Opitutus sp. WL0086]WRQ89731.1 TonB-dependent receptor [Opitutus sp. WL0086]